MATKKPDDKAAAKDKDPKAAAKPAKDKDGKDANYSPQL